MSPRGKQNNPAYTGITGQIPKALKRQFAAKLAFYDDLDVNTALERLIDAWITGQIEIGQPSDAPQDPPLPSPVKTSPPKTRSPKPSAATTPSEAVTELASIRDALGYSRQQLADALGDVPNTSKSAIGRYLRGDRPTPPEVLTAAKALLDSQ